MNNVNTKINLYQVLMIIVAIFVLLLGNAGLNHLFYPNTKGMVLETRINYLENSVKNIDEGIKEILIELRNK